MEEEFVSAGCDEAEALLLHDFSNCSLGHSFLLFDSIPAMAPGVTMGKGDSQRVQCNLSTRGAKNVPTHVRAQAERSLAFLLHCP